MKTNNRPNHEKKLYELRCTKHDDETHVIYSNGDFLKEDTNSRVCDGIYRATGIVKIELTPYDDAEYIEYLEKEVNERTIVARNLMGNSLSLQRENQELKEQVNSNAEIATKAIDRVNQLEKPIQFGTLATMSFTEHNKETLYTQAYVDKQQDQFLKAVESVFEEHFEYDNYFNIKCNCGYTIDNDFEEHLLQEIKSAIEKGKE